MKVLVPLVEGFEEIEAITPINILRRAGASVTTAGATGLVRGGRGVSVQTDAMIADVLAHDWDMIVLPGGPGTKNLLGISGILERLKRQAREDYWLAAICAAPTILHAAGLLTGKRVACFPTVEESLMGVEIVRDPVIVDGRIITSRGAGTALPFALALVQALYGPAKRTEISRQIVCE